MGETDSTHFKETLNKVDHYTKNCFNLPYGNVRKLIVAELARTCNALATGFALESVALMATTVLPIMGVQKPHNKSKVKGHLAPTELFKDGGIFLSQEKSNQGYDSLAIPMYAFATVPLIYIQTVKIWHTQLRINKLEDS